MVSPRNEPPSPPRSPPHIQRFVSSTTKQSSRSQSSSSFEADDEQSFSDRDSMDPEPNRQLRGPPQYAGEDTRWVSKKELAGWYAYGFAAEVFVICGVGSFIPITLEQLARERGVLLSDKNTPCKTGFNAQHPPNSNVAPLSMFSRSLPADTGQCIVYLFGFEINTASFAMYTFSLSVLIQAIVVVSISCAADHGNYRKKLLLAFAFTGAVATMLFLPITSSVYVLGALLAIISNTCFGASFVLLNSFLPLLVRHHPSTQYTPEESREVPPTSIGTESSEESLIEATQNRSAAESLADSTIASIPEGTLDMEQSQISTMSLMTSRELSLSTELSSKGIGIGYSAGLFVQCVSVVVLLLTSSTTFSLRLVLFIIGLWWLVFTIPSAMWLRPRPGPPLPSPNPSKTDSSRSWIGYIGYAWMSLWRTVKLARRLKDIVLFLIAWFLLSDAIATVSGTAILFAKTSLNMKPAALALINVIATTAGVLGAFTWRGISRYFHLQPHHTILACICLFEIIPLYGLLGYLPFIQNWEVLGLQQPWEMYPLGFLYGFVLGGLSSYCRALFGELIPPGSEAAFYALYAITDKGSSVFGPAIVGAITDATGEIRPAFWFLAVLVGLPGPIIWCVDVERGKQEGEALKEVIEGFKVSEGNEYVIRSESTDEGEGERLLAGEEGAASRSAAGERGD